MIAASKALARQASANRHWVTGVIRLWPLNRNAVSNLRYLGPTTLPIENCRYFSAAGTGQAGEEQDKSQVSQKTNTPSLPPVLESNTDSTQNDQVVATFSIPANMRPLVVGGGATIASIEKQSGAQVVIERRTPTGSPIQTLEVKLSGSKKSIDLARSQIESLISTAGTTRPTAEPRTPEAIKPHQEEFFLAGEEGGYIIGKGGHTIKKLMAETVGRAGQPPRPPHRPPSRRSPLAR
jgi:hypothetical protein